MNMIKRIFCYIGLIVSTPLYFLYQILSTIGGIPILSILVGLALVWRFVKELLLMNHDWLILRILTLMFMIWLVYIVSSIFAFVEMLAETVLLFITTPFMYLYFFCRETLFHLKAEKENNAHGQEAEESYSYNQDFHEKNHQQQAEDKTDPIAEARELYGFTGEFTRDELKKRKRELQKKYHPDNLGNLEMAKKINVGFDHLKKIAV